MIAAVVRKTFQVTALDTAVRLQPVPPDVSNDNGPVARSHT